MSKLLVSATHKSSGKTIVSIGLLAHLNERGINAQSFKKGPDYIDPAWLTLAANKPCYNLDFHTQTDSEIKALFLNRSVNADVALIEANKGLFDGMDVNGSDSNAALAKQLACPVVLVIDCEGITRGVAPLLQGYLQFDKEVSFAGVILNKVAGQRHQAKLINAIEQYTDIQVLGAIAKDQCLILPERHLGLTTSNQHANTHAFITDVKERIAEQVDVNQLLDTTASPKPTNIPPLQKHTKQFNLCVGILRDQAFSFYYPDDIETFEAFGVQLCMIDSLKDSALPAVDALFIGGGFPEIQAQALEKNKAMRSAIRQAIEDNLPVYAECGGLMYLSQSIRYNDKQYAMCGVIPADTVMHQSPQGRGYVTFTENDDLIWGNVNTKTIYNAHEFHYSALTHLPEDITTAIDIQRGVGIGQQRDGIVYKHLLATYLHRRSCENDPWILRFLQFVERIQHTN